MPESGKTLLHGTTRSRAEKLLTSPPNPHYHQPGDTPHYRAEIEFSMYEWGHYGVGSAAEYAKFKAALFPDEGGPAILEVDVPDELLDPELWIGYWQFYGDGLAALILAWHSLPKRVTDCDRHNA